jgi:hypothetical protein
MYLYTDFGDPAELTGYARTALADLEINQFTLSQYLPSQTINDLDYRFTRGGEGLIEAATYRSYDAEAPLGARPGITRTQGELPPLSRKIRLGEYDRLKSRNLDSQITNAIYSDLERMTRSLAARVELARGDALVNGKVTISENGVSAAVDFGRNAGNSVTAGTYWTDLANAKPLTDLLAWQQSYVDVNGSEPGKILMAKKNMAQLMQNAQIKGLVYPQGSPAALVKDTDVRGVLTAFGLPGIDFYDAKVRVAGVDTRVIPDNILIFLPGGADAGQLGRVLWGTTAEASEPSYGLAGNEAGVVAGTYTTWDPVALWTKAAAIALPVVVNPNLTFVAKIAA